MAFTEDEVNEFKIEAAELLDQGEKSLLALDAGGDFKFEFDAIFRAFHSIKGAAGMIEMTDLQSHMHHLESLLVEQKSKPVLAKQLVDHFLLGIDACRSLLEGKLVNFDHAPPTVSERVANPLVTSIKTAGASHHKPKAMVIDDEISIVSLLTEILEHRGFEVQGYESPEKALADLEILKPDVVLTDVMMPTLSGLDVLREVRKANPDLPVVFVSAHADKDVLLKAIEMGVYAVLEKPFSMTKVIEVARNAVERQRLTHLVNSSINLLMYQFSDLDDFLVASGKSDIRNVIDREIKTLLDQRRRLKNIA